MPRDQRFKDPFDRKFHEATRLAALDEPGRVRYRSLVELRARLAREAGVPAYQILSNEQLLHLCETKARPEDELAALPGMNRLRLKAFGEDLSAGLRALP